MIKDAFFQVEHCKRTHGPKGRTRRRYGMFDEREEWKEARDELVWQVKHLGFEEALGNEIAKNLGNPKAMQRMAAYLRYEKPKKVEVVVDEMLAIKSEIEAWREKKESEDASARYYMMRRRGLFDSEE